MPELSGRLFPVKDKFQLLILVVLIINTTLVVFGFIFLIDRLISDDTMFAEKQKLAQSLSEYNHRLANECGVYNMASVQEALAEYNYKVDHAASGDELFHIIFNQGRLVQEVIIAEADSMLKEKVLVAVNNDSRVRNTTAKTHLQVRFADGQISITPDQFLESKTIQQINNILLTDRYHSNQTIDIEVIEGVGRFILIQTVEEQIKLLNEEINLLRSSLYEIRIQSGLAEMVGPGITLYLYDAEEAMGSGSLVHDADIRDIVNEMFSSGARGVSVGNQRLITTSAIRCSGPLIMVNFRQIPTNPVIIQAIGDPDLLISGLSVIRNDLERRRGLDFEINYSGFIKLPAYHHSY